MKHLIWIPVCVTLGLVAGCASDQPEPAAEVVPTPAAAKTPLPNWSFTLAMLFPADGSLLRPEDGEVLPDGRTGLIGLRRCVGGAGVGVANLLRQIGGCI